MTSWTTWTRRTCLRVTSIRPWDVLHVPDAVMTHAERKALATSSPGCVLGYVPSQLMSRDICMRAVRLDGLSLRWVRKDLMDLEMCIEAMRDDKRAIKYVPEPIMACIMEG